MGDTTVDWSTVSLALVEPTYSLLSSACLLYYEYFLTLPKEVQLIWRGRWSPATGFYLAIRYGALLVITLSLFSVFYRDSSADPGPAANRCRAVMDTLLIINGINFAIISAFVALRISAIWSRNLYLGVLLFILGLFNPSSVTPMLAFGMEALPGPRPLVACVSYLSQDPHSLGPLLIRYFPIACSVIGIIYESLCLLLTVTKTYSLYRDQQQAGMSTRLTSLLLRDGSLYFAVLTVLAVLNIVSASIPPGSLPADIQINTDIARVLTPILITRFIMDLRTLDQAERPLTGAVGHLSTVQFKDSAAASCAPRLLSMPFAFDFDSDLQVEDSPSCSTPDTCSSTSYIV